MGRPHGRVAVIAGEASGVGLAAAGLFGAGSSAAVIGDLRQEQADRAAETVRAAGGRTFGMAVDVMEESLAALVARAVEESGRLDVMCNRAGGSDPRRDLDLLRLDLDEFDHTTALNVRSTVLGCRLALHHLVVLR